MVVKMADTKKIKAGYLVSVHKVSFVIVRLDRTIQMLLKMLVTINLKPKSTTVSQCNTHKYRKRTNLSNQPKNNPDCFINTPELSYDRMITASFKVNR
jgi:hypothetical protein